MRGWMGPRFEGGSLGLRVMKKRQTSPGRGPLGEFTDVEVYLLHESKTWRVSRDLGSCIFGGRYLHGPCTHLDPDLCFQMPSVTYDPDFHLQMPSADTTVTRGAPCSEACWDVPPDTCVSDLQ